MTVRKPHLKGASEVPPLLVFSTAGRSAQQSATILARLERQKAMLEKQLQTWLRQKMLTEHRLHVVRAEICKVTANLKAANGPEGARRHGLTPGAVVGRVKRGHIDFTF